MPKGPGSPIRPRKRPLTDDHIKASVARGMDPETGHYAELIYGGIETEERALEIKRSLYRCAKFLGYSMKADIEKTATGYQVRFKAIDKDKARAYTARQYKETGKIAYNPYAKVKRDD